MILIYLPFIFLDGLHQVMRFHIYDWDGLETLPFKSMLCGSILKKKLSYYRKFLGNPNLLVHTIDALGEKGIDVL